MRLTPAERLWRGVQKGPECWLWTRYADPRGYGFINVGGRPRSTHRLAWTITFGPIPPNMFVLHKCDTPACCRPDHLFLGSQFDNMQDRKTKGRFRKRGHGIPLPKRPPTLLPPRERFWSKVQKGPECWIWMGTPTPNGRGTMYFDGRNQLPYRIAWQLTRGPIPNGLCVLHTCDHVFCVNPDHLFLGTMADNMRDMREKGRAAPLPIMQGDEHPMAKLTSTTVVLIRSRHANGVSTAALARQYGVTYQTIRSALRHETWNYPTTK